MLRKLLAGATLALAALAGPGVTGARAQDSVKIAYIDPLSGAFADVGDQGLRHFRYMAERINAAGGVAGGKKLEIVPFDNKTDPKETQVQLDKAAGQGIHYVAQGNGSSVASAIIGFVDKYNERNPDSRMLFLNYAAVDPAFTNDKCSFWHFRFDADADMKMEGLTDWLATQKDLKKVYILGQDYSFGKAVASAANKMIKAKRPDAEIVGDELHPLGKVKDFSPYIAKMKASGAQVVVTGNWGQDLTLLIKAAADAGYNVPFLTYYGGGLGTPTAMGKSAVGLAKQVSEFHKNVEGHQLDALIEDFEKKEGIDFYYYRVKNLMEMLAKAMNETNSTDPLKVAQALEGMTYKNEMGTVTMRKDNHQLIQPMFVSTFSEGVKYQAEKSGYGFKTDYRIEPEKTMTETTCKMKRPTT